MGAKDQARNDITLAFQTILREKQLAPVHGLLSQGHPSSLSGRSDDK
jgi:hypothetical protein